MKSLGVSETRQPPGEVGKEISEHQATKQRSAHHNIGSGLITLRWMVELAKFNPTPADVSPSSLLLKEEFLEPLHL